MSDKQIILLVGGAIVAALIIWIIILIVKDYKKGKAENRREKIREAKEEMLNDMGTVTSLHAEVVDMSCGVTSIGYQNFKQPRAEKYFIIAFKDDNGESLQISVDEELYGGFEIGMKGNLTLIDGQLSSFELDGN